MGIFRKREQTVEPPVDDVLLSALLRGEPITREKAMTVPAVSAAVGFISDLIASMPVKLYKNKNGKIEEQKNDERVKILNVDTGDMLDGYQLKKALVEDYLLGKGGYAYIRKYKNQVTGLFYVPDIYVAFLKNYKPIFKNFTILVEGKEYKHYEFVKLLRRTADGASGIGLLAEVSKALETAYQTLIYQLNAVLRGGSKKGFLKSTRKLGQAEIDVLKNAWQSLYAAGQNNVVVLNEGLEFKEASNSSVELQINESTQTLQAEINNIFRIRPNFYDTFREAIYPIVKAFETALNRDLLLENEKKYFYFKFDVMDVLKANLKERYETYKLAKETALLTINEMRESENLSKIDGMDVVNVGLGAVLYDINTHTYYTPNTDTKTNPMEKELETLQEEQAFEQSGNSSL